MDDRELDQRLTRIETELERIADTIDEWFTMQSNSLEIDKEKKITVKEKEE